MDSITMDYTRSSPASNQNIRLTICSFLNKLYDRQSTLKRLRLLSCTGLYACISVMIMSMMLVCMNNKRLNYLFCSYELHFFLYS